MTTLIDATDRHAPEALSIERLEAQICALAARRAADECDWLLLIAEFDRREASACGSAGRRRTG
jgi:hypothetical protein